MSKFQIGDRVKFVEDYQRAAKGTEATVTDVRDYGGDLDTYFDATLDDGTQTHGACVTRAELIEQDAEAQPVTFRICVGNVIGSTEHKTLEAALAEAEIHGSNGEQFSVFEVVKIADYRVKVTKEIEAL